MARFLIGTIAATGHVNPALPIARQLVQQGHEVWWYTGKGLKDKVEATGAHHVSIGRGIDLTVPETI
jgi:UDP:flavonoid glycosyltransferase YjiC (YdhE family)